MKTYVLFVWLSFVGGSAIAKNVWTQGELVLTNGTVLSGELSYNWKAEIVQHRTNNTIKAFSAFQVKEFKYFDNDLNTLRKFVTVEYPVKPLLLRTVFMEEVATGTMMIYRRLRHIREPIPIANSVAFKTDDEVIKKLDSFQYYIYEGDQMTNLTDFSESLWPRMQTEFMAELNRYASTLHIDLTSTLARLLLIAHYNQLKARADLTSLTSDVTSGNL